MFGWLRYGTLRRQYESIKYAKLRVQSILRLNIRHLSIMVTGNICWPEYNNICASAQTLKPTWLAPSIGQTHVLASRQKLDTVLTAQFLLHRRQPPLTYGVSRGGGFFLRFLGCHLLPTIWIQRNPSKTAGSEPACPQSTACNSFCPLNGLQCTSCCIEKTPAQKGKYHVATFSYSLPDEALCSLLVIKLHSHSHSHSQEYRAFPKSAYRRSTVQESAQELSMPKACSKRAANSLPETVKQKIPAPNPIDFANRKSQMGNLPCS